MNLGSQYLAGETFRKRQQRGKNYKVLKKMSKKDRQASPEGKDKSDSPVEFQKPRQREDPDYYFSLI